MVRVAGHFQRLEGEYDLVILHEVADDHESPVCRDRF